MDNGALHEDEHMDAVVQTSGTSRALTYGTTTPSLEIDRDSTSKGFRLSEEEQRPLLESGHGNDGTEDDGHYADDDTAGSLPWWKTPSIWWIIPPFLISTLAFGGVLVPQLKLILELVCRDYIAEQSLLDPNTTLAPVIFGEENPQCRSKAVSKRSAQFTLYTNVISGLLSAITAPKIGALSDRYGRKKLLGFSSIGAFCKEVVMIVAAKQPDTFPIGAVLIAYALDGIFGSYTALMAIIHSYAADTTTPSKRGAAFGYFHGCLFIGIALGPVLAGYIIEATGTVISVFYIALVAHILYTLHFVFVIPESVSKERQHAAREKHRLARRAVGPAADWINQLRSINILEPLKILYPTGPGSNSVLRRNLILLSAIDTIIFGVAMGSMTIVVIYVDYQFGWNTVQSENFVSIVNSSRVFALLVILPALTWFFRTRRQSRAAADDRGHHGADLFDLSMVRVGILFDTLGYLGYTLVRSGDLFIAAGCIASLGGIAAPTLQGALTKHVPADKVGQLLGATGLLHALARVGGPVIFNGIYRLTLDLYTQTVFVCLTAAFGLAFLCSWFVRPHVHFNETEAVIADEDQAAGAEPLGDEAAGSLLGRTVAGDANPVPASVA